MINKDYFFPYISLLFSSAAFRIAIGACEFHSKFFPNSVLRYLNAFHFSWKKSVSFAFAICKMLILIFMDTGSYELKQWLNCMLWKNEAEKLKSESTIIKCTQLQK